MNKKIPTIINSISNNYSKKIGIDLKYFITGGFWLSFGYSLNVTKSLILSILLANFISPQIYGQYIFVMSLIGIAAIFSLQGMNSATTQAIAKGYEGTYFKTLKLIFNWSFLGSLMLLLIALYGKITGHNYGTMIIVIIALLFPLYSISTNYINYFTGKKQFKKLIILNNIFTIISLITISLAIYFTKEVLWIILITLLSHILIQGYYSLFIVKKYLKNNKIKKENLNYGKKTSLSYAYNIIAGKLDSILITYFLGFEKLAIYTIVTLIPNQLKILFGVFNPLILPKLSEKNNLSGIDLYKQVKKLILITIGVIIIYILIAPILFKYVYPKYYQYVWLSMFFSISSLITTNSLIEGYLQSKLNNKKLNQLNYTYSTISIILLLITVKFGIFWIILGRIIHRFIIIISGVLILKKLK